MKLGNEDITLKVGSLDVEAVYLGDTLMYTETTPFEGKWLATYSDSSTTSAECDSTSAITQYEIGLSNLVSLEIGNCVTTLGDNAFRYCSSLSSCTIGSGVTSINNMAFLDCRSLTSIVIPSGVTSIGVCAFYACSGLTSIDIPNGITTINDETFWGCTGLTNVTLGSGITSIGTRAFRYCSSLVSFTIYATTPPSLGTRAFNDTSEFMIYVPAESVAAYQSAWSAFSSRIQAIS